MSRLYQFILNQWILGKDEAYVTNAYIKDYIIEEEKRIILATPQSNVGGS